MSVMPETPAWLAEAVTDVPAGDAALALIADACRPAITQHSIRTLRYAMDIAGRAEPDVDYAALVLACLLHDLGASELAAGAERFEVQGADLAVNLLAEHGWEPGARQDVWVAIATHTSPHIAERLSPLTRSLRLGVLADFGADLISPALRRETEELHPRLQVEHVLSGVVVEQALIDERRAPAASWPAALLEAHRSSTDPDARLKAF
jgi:hypothetical protein